jgi:hypothetical protein
VQSHRRLTASRASLDDEYAVTLVRYELELVLPDRLDDVPHPAVSGPFEVVEQEVAHSHALLQGLVLLARNIRRRVLGQHNSEFVAVVLHQPAVTAELPADREGAGLVVCGEHPALTARARQDTTTMSPSESRTGRRPM